MSKTPPRPLQNKRKAQKDLLALGQKHTFAVPPDRDGVRVDKFLKSVASWLSRHAIQRRIAADTVMIGDRLVKPSTKVRANDVVTVLVPQPPDVVAETRDIPLDVIYEDQWILVINKRAHIVVHPTGRRQSGTIIQAVHYRYRETIAEDPVFNPRLLHRLDRETSGVLALSKYETAHRDLAIQFERRRVAKEHVAVVEGLMERDSGEISLPIGPAAKSEIGVKMDVRQDIGRRAHTDYEVVERFAHHTLVRLSPHTGRSHQLRVHLAAIGHPIVADQLYRDERVFLDYVERGLTRRQTHPLLDRHALHAWRLTLTHQDQRMTFEAPPTPDFAALLDTLRRQWDQSLRACCPNLRFFSGGN